MTPSSPTPAGEVGGAFGDLGTLLPILLGAVAVAGMPAGGVLVGFGAFLLATGLIYRLPLPVQPMKAVGALVVAGGLAPGEVAAAGVAGGVILLALALSGATAWAARVVPRSAVIGLQLGVGATMAWIGFGLAWGGPLAAGVALALLLALPRLTSRLPAVPLALAGAILADLAAGGALPPLPSPSFALPRPVLPAGVEEIWRGLVVGALPQLPLTLANAVLLPALLAREMFPPGDAARASERRLGLATGAANALLAPLGALPMCHGAGGLVAQHRFGARTGWAPALLGVALLTLGLLFAGDAARLLGAIPPGASARCCCLPAATSPFRASCWKRGRTAARPSPPRRSRPSPSTRPSASPLVGSRSGRARPCGRSGAPPTRPEANSRSTPPLPEALLPSGPDRGRCEADGR